jgi:hypothetical protein
MTIPRQLAVKIMNLSAGYATPGAREWVDAMSRELDFIENDWSALWWALGSTRVLFKRPHVPLADMSVVPRAAKLLAKTIRRRTLVGSVATLTEAVFFGSFLFAETTLMVRVASALTVAAVLYIACQLYARRAGRPPSDSSLAASAEFYRMELKRQRDFHRGSWFWSRQLLFLPGPVLFCVAEAMAQPDSGRRFLAVMAAFMLLWWRAVSLNLRLANNYQRRLDELDALQSRGE